MMIKGSGEEKTVLGPFDSWECPVCGQKRPFTAVCVYKYIHWWFVCSIVHRKTYLLECDHCHNTISGDTFEIRKMYPGTISGLPANGAGRSASP